MQTINRTLTITPVVTRDLLAMEAVTDEAFRQASSARWYFWHEEGTIGMTSKERLVFLFFVLEKTHDGRNAQQLPRTINNCSTYLNMDISDVSECVESLIERGSLNDFYRCNALYDDRWVRGDWRIRGSWKTPKGRI